MIVPSYSNGFARSAGESANPNSWNGLVCAGIPELGATGRTVFDHSGFGNNGTLTAASGSATWNVKDGKRCVTFDADDAAVNQQVIELPDFSGRFTKWATFHMVLRLNEHTPTDGNQTGAFDLSTGIADVYPFTDGILYIGIFRLVRLTLGDIGIADRTQWHLVTVTSAPGAGNWNFYQNGVLYATNTGDSNIALDGPNMRLCGSSGSNYLNGDVAFYSFYNRVQPIAEIRQTYLDYLAPFQLRQQIFKSPVKGFSNLIGSGGLVSYGSSIIGPGGLVV